MERLGSIKFEHESFNILQILAYTMELMNVKAEANKLHLILTQEASFPSDVTGDRVKFETIMTTVLDFLISCNENNEIKLLAKMKNPIDGGYLLCFEFEVEKSAKINQQSLQKLFTGEEIEGFPFEFRNCSSIAKALNGMIDMTETENGKVQLKIDLSFENRSLSKELFEPKKMSIYDVTKLNEYSLTWTKKKPEIKKEISQNLSSNDGKIESDSKNKEDESCAKKAKDKIKEVLSRKKKAEEKEGDSQVGSKEGKDQNSGDHRFSIQLESSPINGEKPIPHFTPIISSKGLNEEMKEGKDSTGEKNGKKMPENKKQDESIIPKE